MNFNLVYDANCPKELKAVLVPMFEQLHMLVPKWVEDVYVTFEDDQDKDYTVAETTSCVEYRRVFLRFYPDFLYERDDKLYQFAHELLHSIYGTVYQYAYSTFANLLSGDADSRLQKQVAEQLRVYNESSTQDLTNMVFNLLGVDKRTGKKAKKR